MISIAGTVFVTRCACRIHYDRESEFSSYSAVMIRSCDRDSDRGLTESCALFLGRKSSVEINESFVNGLNRLNEFEIATI